MKNNLFLLSVFALLSLNTFGQTAIDSEIATVKVFKQNAQITRNISFTLHPELKKLFLREFQPI